MLEEWEPIDAALRETPSCAMVIAMRGGGTSVLKALRESKVDKKTVLREQSAKLSALVKEKSYQSTSNTRRLLPTSWAL